MQQTDTSSTLVAELNQRFNNLLICVISSNFQDNLKEDSLRELTAASLWQILYNHYTEPQRHYHTLQHILNMLSHFDKVACLLHYPIAVELAIWYHDIIYLPKATDNERQSANCFKQQLADYLPSQLSQQVESFIMMTEKHQLLPDLQNRQPYFKEDARYFLDMDLAILGTDWDTYTKYTQQIRSEYKHLSLTDYNQGRAAVLENFLNRKRLYFSKLFYDKYEHQARQNINREIQQLTLI